MRLWHYKLIPLLPRQQLLGQHRECCAMRGKGWGKKHLTIDYVFKHPFYCLLWYHFQVMMEMKKREYFVDPLWFNLTWRGKILGFQFEIEKESVAGYNYPEHNDQYYQECLDNLKAKGVVLNGS